MFVPKDHEFCSGSSNHVPQKRRPLDGRWDVIRNHWGFSAMGISIEGLPDFLGSMDRTTPKFQSVCYLHIFTKQFSCTPDEVAFITICFGELRDPRVHS